ELELGAMIRQLERAANSVAGGAEATAATLSTIRQRTDVLTGRTSSAQSTATMFAQAADKFTHSAEGIGSQVRGASQLADQDSAAEIDSAAKEAETHGERVASAGQAVTMFAQKLKSRCALLMGQDANEERRKRERLPCNLKIEIQTLRGPITAAVYEISMQGV